MRWLARFWRSEPQTIKITVQFILERDGDGFHAYSPLLKGLHADGRSEDEAVKNFVAEIPAYLHSLVKHGDPLPVGMVRFERRSAERNVPSGAFMRHIRQTTLLWPSQGMFGTR